MTLEVDDPIRVKHKRRNKMAIRKCSMKGRPKEERGENVGDGVNRRIA